MDPVLSPPDAHSLTPVDLSDTVPHASLPTHRPKTTFFDLGSPSCYTECPLADAVLDTSNAGFRIGRLIGGEAPRDCMGKARVLVGFWMTGLGN